MEQINEKLNKIAKAIDETVELPETNLITDSLDAITKALGGTPIDSNLIVDKLDDIAGVAEPKPTGNIEITENGENINVAPYATATVNVSGGGGDDPRLVIPEQEVTITEEEPYPLIANVSPNISDYEMIAVVALVNNQTIGLCPQWDEDNNYYEASDRSTNRYMQIINVDDTYLFGYTSLDMGDPIPGTYTITAFGIYEGTGGGGGK